VNVLLGAGDSIGRERVKFPPISGITQKFGQWGGHSQWHPINRRGKPSSKGDDAFHQIHRLQTFNLRAFDMGFSTTILRSKTTCRTRIKRWQKGSHWRGSKRGKKEIKGAHCCRYPLKSSVLTRKLGIDVRLIRIASLGDPGRLCKAGIVMLSAASVESVCIASLFPLLDSDF
jgi:hypothetical protein